MLPLRTTATLIVAILHTLLFLVLPLSAQTDNYWSWNFNTHSNLVGGAVVAGNAGPSAIYYNPALIAPENMSSLALSANVVSIQFYKVEDFAGSGIDAKEELFKVQPKFLAYAFSSENKKWALAVALLSPISEEVRFSYNHLDTLEVIERTKGDEIYTGYSNYSRAYDDTWVGMGFTYKQSQRFSLGGSFFVSDKILRYSYRQQTRAFQAEDSVDVGGVMEPRYIASNSFEEELNYWFVSLLFKVGAVYKASHNRFSVGANLSFPSIPLFGSADVSKTYNRHNVYDNAGDTFTSNENIDTQEKSNSNLRVKTPFALSLGTNYQTKTGNTSLMLTGEYFHRIDPYEMVSSSLQTSWLPQYVTQQLQGQSYMAYTSQARAVFNIALGFQQRISPLATYLGGFRTDFYANHTDDSSSLQYVDQVKKTSLNKYHATSGVAFQIRRASIVTGVQYTFGRSTSMIQPVNYESPLEYHPTTDLALQGTRTNTVNASVNELSLFLGLEVGL